MTRHQRLQAQLCLQQRRIPGQPLTSGADRFRRQLGSPGLTVFTCLVRTAVPWRRGKGSPARTQASRSRKGRPEGPWPGGHVGPGCSAPPPRKRRARDRALKSLPTPGAPASWAGVPWGRGRLLRTGTGCQRHVGRSPAPLLAPLPRGPRQARMLRPRRVVEARWSPSMDVMVQGWGGPGGWEGGAGGRSPLGGVSLGRGPGE